MPTRVIPGLLMLLFCLVFAMGVRAQLEATPAKVDFGRQRQDRQLSAEVELRNKGAEELEILGADSNCRCTAAMPEKTRLAPGERTTLKVSFQTRSYLGVQQQGVVVRTTRGDLHIPVHIEIAQFDRWSVTPYPLIMRTSQRGQAETIQVALRHTGGRTAVRKVEAAFPWLRAAVAGEDGENFTLTLTKQPEAPAGYFTVKVAVESTDDAEPSIRFDVFVPVNSPLKISPSPVILPTVQVGQETVREIVLQGYGGAEAPRFELASGSIRSLVRDGEKWKAEVAVTPSSPGPMTRMLRVYDGEKLELEVPVILRAEPARADK